MYLHGTDRPSLIEFGQKTWGISVAQIDNYIAEAKVWIQKKIDMLAERGMEVSLARRLMLLKKCIDANDRGLAHEIIKDLDKLLGKYPRNVDDEGMRKGDTNFFVWLNSQNGNTKLTAVEAEQIKSLEHSTGITVTAEMQKNQPKISKETIPQKGKKS